MWAFMYLRKYLYTIIFTHRCINGAAWLFLVSVVCTRLSPLNCSIVLILNDGLCLYLPSTLLSLTISPLLIQFFWMSELTAANLDLTLSSFSSVDGPPATHLTTQFPLKRLLSQRCMNNCFFFNASS